MTLFPSSFRYSMRLGLIIFLVSIPILGIVNALDIHPEFGGFVSIATNFVYGATIVGGISAFAGIFYARRNKILGFSFENRLVNIFGTISITVAYAFLVGTVSYMGANFLATAFQGVKIDSWAMILMVAGIFGVIGYLIALNTTRFTETTLLKVTIVYLLSGLGVAMLAAQNREWWENSLSYMGHDAGSDFFFRSTLFFGGFLAVLVGNLLLRDYKVLQEKGYLNKKTMYFLTYLLNAVGILIMLIGIFRTTVSPISDMIHNGSGSILAASLIIASFSLPFLIKKLAPEFKVISFIVGGTIIAVALLWAIFGIASFVFFEIALFGLVALWVPLFFQATKLLVEESKS
jgi:hypothetical protein